MGRHGPCLRRARRAARAASAAAVAQRMELLPPCLRHSRRPRAFSARSNPRRTPSWGTTEVHQGLTPPPVDSRPSWTSWLWTQPRPWIATAAFLLAKSVEQPIWLRLPLRWPSLRRGRCADALRTDRQLKASKPMKRRPRAARVDASAGTGSTAPWPSARALTLSQRLAGRA